jgi:hypothetical protein
MPYQICYPNGKVLKGFGDFIDARRHADTKPVYYRTGKRGGGRVAYHGADIVICPESVVPPAYTVMLEPATITDGHSTITAPAETPDTASDEWDRDDEDDLRNWTVSELRATAIDEGIPGTSRMNKADLIAALEGNDNVTN